MPMCELHEPFAGKWHDRDPFTEIAALPGEDFRRIKNRRTFRITVKGKNFFIKHHRGTGWAEIIKNLLQFKLPVIGADTEVNALKKLHSLRLPTMDIIAYGKRNCNPAKRESFIITAEITDAVSLEDLIKNALPASLRHKLIRQLARIVSTMHQNGINHRDCYLCHFLWQQASETLFVIDLHRAQIRRKIPRRYRIKDLAGLYFSALDMPPGRSDIWRFIREYSGNKLHDEVNKNLKFWRSVRNKAYKLYNKEFGHLPEKAPF